MSQDIISVLVVDDSALMRNLISRIIDGTPGMVVAGKAMNGVFALQKLERLHPDVIVLDIEMPQMNGLEFLEERRKRGIDIPVVVLSSIAQKGARVTMDALSLGASDFLLKPSGPVSEDIHTVAGQLTEMVRGYGTEYRRRKGRTGASPDSHQATPVRPPASARGETPAPERPHTPSASAATSAHGAATAAVSPASPVAPAGTTEIIAIGISTGGPNALRKVFAAIDDTLAVPIVVVQHMPAGFTLEFAKSLDRICPLTVKEAQEGDELTPGRVLIAPGNRHLVVERRGTTGVVHLHDDPPRNGHRPSADVLFASVAEHYGNRALAVIMTGMGRDGAAELGTIHRAGGITVGQDSASCVVYGMPKVAFELGNVQHQVPLHLMAETICRLAGEKRGGA